MIVADSVILCPDCFEDRGTLSTSHSGKTGYNGGPNSTVCSTLIVVKEMERILHEWRVCTECRALIFSSVPSWESGNVDYSTGTSTGVASANSNKCMPYQRVYPVNQTVTGSINTCSDDPGSERHTA